MPNTMLAVTTTVMVAERAAAISLLRAVLTECGLATTCRSDVVLVVPAAQGKAAVAAAGPRAPRAGDIALRPSLFA